MHNRRLGRLNTISLVCDVENHSVLLSPMFDMTMTMRLLVTCGQDSPKKENQITTNIQYYINKYNAIYTYNIHPTLDE